MLSALFVLTLADPHYGIVVDAGSCGTRAYLYVWEDGPGIPNVRLLSNSNSIYKTSERLADAADTPALIPSIFDPIIEFALQGLPQSFYSTTLMFVYATGGVRILPEVAQNRTMQATYDFLAERSPFKILPENVRVIDGIEEATFAWLAANQYLGTFKNGRPKVRAMDMGGASFQIAMEAGGADQDVQTINFGSHRIPLYASSYLGYGVVEALNTVSRWLIVNSTADGMPVEHPCFPVDFQTTFRDRRIVGTGNFEKCAKLVRKLLIDPVSFPQFNLSNRNATSQFVAMATFYYANSFFDLPMNSTLAQFKTAVVKFCETDWEESLKSGIKPGFLKMYCWYGVFQWMLLTEGYHFQDKDVILTKMDLSWTLGAMLSHAGQVEDHLSEMEEENDGVPSQNA
jgi:Golgi nucleoside diphosphatase